MATNTVGVSGNILDVLKFKMPDGSAVDQPINAMVELNDFQMDMPALPANGGMTHQGLRTIQLPTGYLTDVGGSWKSSKAEFEMFIDGLMTLRSTYRAPIDTYEVESAEIGQAQLEANLDGHIHALTQGLMNMMLEGSSVPNQSGLSALMQRDPYTTHDSSFTFSVGGSGSNLRSAWLMKPGIDTVHTVYNPNHPTLGIEQKDMGVHPVTGLGTSSDEHRWDMWIEHKIVSGIVIKDQTAVKRICNIPVGLADYPGEDVINLAIEASIINATKQPGKSQGLGTASQILNTWMLYCDERLYAKIVRASNDKLMVYMSDQNIYRTSLPMIGTNIIIRRMDALNHALGSGETEIAAAS